MPDNPSKLQNVQLPTQPSDGLGARVMETHGGTGGQVPLPALCVMEIRNYGKVDDVVGIQNLIQIQTRAYRDFLQVDVPASKRKNLGIEAILREIFPISNYDGTMSLDYIKYDLGKPRYIEDECRQLRLTYGCPFRIWLRLNRAEPIEEEVYLGEIPVMIGGGEFIINGTERVIVTQLHRSPGIDFIEEFHAEKRLHSAE